MVVALMVWNIFSTIIWLAIPALFLWLMVDGLRTGVIRARHGTVSRTAEPLRYWIYIAIYCGFIAWLLYIIDPFHADVPLGGN